MSVTTTATATLRTGGSTTGDVTKIILTSRETDESFPDADDQLGEDVKGSDDEPDRDLLEALDYLGLEIDAPSQPPCFNFQHFCRNQPKILKVNPIAMTLCMNCFERFGQFDQYAKHTELCSNVLITQPKYTFIDSDRNNDIISRLMGFEMRKG